jgi:hypothetical protein
MEMLLSPHLEENLSEIMRTSYNIYSSLEFIGFCVIYNNGKALQSHLLLFEGAFTTTNGLEHHRTDTGKTYPLKTSDETIVRDLMSSAMPSLKNYCAHNDTKTLQIT